MGVKIILASASPRRRELMARAGIPCEIRPVDADETVGESAAPGEQVRIISERKARKAYEMAEKHTPALIVAADTLVCMDGRVWGKPRSPEEAFRMLDCLQGRKHTVYTGVTLMRAGPFETPAGVNTSPPETAAFVETADVYMRALSPEEIRAYIATGEPMDKAGAYGIQEKGAVLIERVEGDYHTVVGLPLARMCRAFKELGVDIMAGWR